MIESIPEGITTTDAMVFKPPAKSLASFWLGDVDSATQVFALSTSPGSIVDVSLSFRLCNVYSSASVAVATAVIGTVYYLALDGPSSNTYVPVGIPTTH